MSKGIIFCLYCLWRVLLEKQNLWYILRKAVCHFSDALRINTLKANSNLKLLPSREDRISRQLDGTHLIGKAQKTNLNVYMLTL